MFKSFAAALIASVALADGGVYDYAQNGDDWSSLNAICGNGKHQSPINLKSDATVADHLRLDFNKGYGSSSVQISKEKYTFKQAWSQGGFTKTTKDNTKQEFVPAQYHIHMPSEHTVDSKHYDMEMHIVHTFADGSLGGVVGFFFEVDDAQGENEFLAAVIKNASQNPANSAVDMGKFIDGLNYKHFWSY